MTADHRSSDLHAVLWDFDGTLADSEHFWMEAQNELIPALGGEWNEAHAKNLVGNALLTSAAYILNVLDRPDLTPEWIVDELTSRVIARLEAGEIPWRPGALELLGELHDRGIPCGLVSASYRSMLDVIVRRLPVGRFDTVVSGDEVTHGKPHPEPYLTAAANLGADPRQCVVIEDSGPGSTSGNASGALVLAVHNVVDIPEADRRRQLDTLAGVTVDDLQDWIAHA